MVENQIATALANFCQLKGHEVYNDLQGEWWEVQQKVGLMPMRGVCLHSFKLVAYLLHLHHRPLDHRACVLNAT